MATFNIDFDFEVQCEKCGRCLNCTAHDSHYGRSPQLTVEPCSRCLEAEHELGFDKGVAWTQR